MNRGELPGYEFEVPRGQRRVNGPRHEFEHDSLNRLQRSRPPEQEPSPVRTASAGLLDVMRRRNWVMGLVAPILAAIAVGIAAVVVVGAGGNGTESPSAMAAGFPPARLAGTGFPTGTSRVALAAIGASGATEVTGGGVNGGPALWSSLDGGTDWTPAVLNGPTSLTRAGAGQLTAVAHGPVGWLAVGGTLLAASADAHTWTVTRGSAAGLGTGNAAAVAAGPAEYVIVGHQSAGGSSAAAWYAHSLTVTGWHRATIASAGQGSQTMNAVAATARGFTAVGVTGSSPAAWLSATGSTWRSVPVPAPSGAERAALNYVTASGTTVVAAGTEFSATGASSAFTEVSVDAGATWTPVQLPVPETAPGAGTTVTALTAAGGGFTAIGTYSTQAGPEVVIWTLPLGASVTDRTAWTAVAPQETGLGSTKTENTITALTADGVNLTGVGFTGTLAASGKPGTQQPTLWQSLIRS